MFRRELQFRGHHVPDLAVGEAGLCLHDHRVLVVHLECVGHGDVELYFLRGEEAQGTREPLRVPPATSWITAALPVAQVGLCVARGEARK